MQLRFKLLTLAAKAFVPAYFQSVFLSFSFFLKELVIMEKSVDQMPRKTFMLARKSFKPFLPILSSLFWGSTKHFYIITVEIKMDIMIVNHFSSIQENKEHQKRYLENFSPHLFQ